MSAFPSHSYMYGLPTQRGNDTKIKHKMINDREAESTALRRRLRLLWKTLCGLLCLGTAVSTVVTVVAAVELRRHLGRSFFSLPLSVHLLLDALVALAPLLAARVDGQGEPPPLVPTSQVLRLVVLVVLLLAAVAAAAVTAAE